ncbi:BrnA antitoxin family protein [uncultured Methylobacterium sp.]|uniref:BrnA antitoxin family protein n=1 Tax=uncultured Methylobacterium sp. TaxID=157278 RepID=UPI002636A24E|nr:BrnA antitoxin family protein [uncultured Methylobacterium sp.]
MTTGKASIPPLTDAEEARIQAQIANDPDSPEITDEEARQLRPFAEALPDLHAAWMRGRGRPRADVTKVAVKLRLDPDIVESYRAGGPGWQTRMNDVLREGMNSHPDRAQQDKRR